MSSTSLLVHILNYTIIKDSVKNNKTKAVSGSTRKKNTKLRRKKNEIIKLLLYYFKLYFFGNGDFFFLGSSSNFENQIRTPIDIYIYLINLNNITIFNL